MELLVRSPGNIDSLASSYLAYYVHRGVRFLILLRHHIPPSQCKIFNIVHVCMLKGKKYSTNLMGPNTNYLRSSDMLLDNHDL